MEKNIDIRRAKIEDINAIWEIIQELNKNKEEFLSYEDKNDNHTKESLLAILQPDINTESIWLACVNKRICGLLDIEYRKADYLFFNDKYMFIRYLTVQDNETEIVEKLMDTAIVDAKKYGFEYICGDMIPEDTYQNELLKKSGLDEYRFRLSKKL